ncbi:regulator of (H+)-ATPase in vacuolar membrane, partial [Tulasnella sp. 403]
ESQDILMSASTVACGGKMLWLDARALGVFLWGRSTESLKNQMEVIARNQYMAGDARDPTACCLFYFALGKVKLVHGLWRQAAWHKEQAIMLKFLANDFSESRWQTAALKNAFALLSKQRYEYAAAFFLLGGSLKDTVNVCLKHLADFQLAVALARVVEGDDGPVLKNILEDHVIPRAFREGNRWLGSWAFWMLKRRDLAVRILLTPLRNLAAELDSQIGEIGDPHYDDPSLALLFGQLKSRSLQTVKGTNEISGQTEFNFVHQMARVLCRMGCHVLALDLVRSWSFERPVPPPAPTRDILEPLDTRLQELQNGDGSLSLNRDVSMSRSRSRVPSSPTMRRGRSRLQRSSMIIDMDLPSFPPTREPSPPTVETIPEQTVVASGSLMNGKDAPRGRLVSPVVGNGEIQVEQNGFGNLMKSAKRDVVVPEFDMSNFF